MCGIAGIVAPYTDERSQTLREMSDVIRHRGPDDAGFYEDSDVALAMRRLAIQDVAHGQQPVFSERKDIVCVFNGELYNVAELQTMLTTRGHVLASHSDTECIPHLYEEFGLDFVDHLRGMFAIALWDKARRRLVLARDRVGKKPLYWTELGGRLRFGSELKALLADPLLPREADPVAINHYLTYQYVPAPWSAVAGVQKLPPAHILVSEAGRTTVRPYWKLEFAPDGAPTRPEAELVEELRDRLLDCVRVRMISERPLGAFLSGGLDSSAVVAAMSMNGASDIKTFSIGFEDEDYNELPHARRVAERYGTDHHELIVRPNALDILPRLVRSFDEPFADSSAIPSWYVADLASRDLVVALNGDGGDEALGGYTRYVNYLTLGDRRMPRSLAKASQRMAPALRRHSGNSRVIQRAATAASMFGEADPTYRYARFVSYFVPEGKLDLATSDFAALVRENDSYQVLDAVWRDYQYTDRTNRLLAVDTRTYLPGDLLPKVDITTMSVSLEARSPFLDHTFLEWAAAIPGGQKIVRGTSKYLLKRALEGWIDDDLIHRRKQGFGVPLAAWLRGELRSLVYDSLTDDLARGRGYFDPSKMAALINGFMAGDDNKASQIYALLMLELWHREVLE